MADWNTGENKKVKRGREKLKHLFSLVNGNAYELYKKGLALSKTIDK